MKQLNIDYFTRSSDDYIRQDATRRTPFYINNSQKQFQIEREYAQALQAAKTQKMFTKPFIRSFGEYSDAVSYIEIHSQDSNICISGSYDGWIKINNIQTGECKTQQHISESQITGIISYGNHVNISDSNGLLQMFYLDNEFKLNKQQQLQFNGKINEIKLYGTLMAILTLFEIKILDANSLQIIKSNNIGGQCLQFVSENIIVIGNDITISIYSIDKNIISNSFQVLQHINSISINQQFQQQVFINCADGFVYSFDQRNPKKAMDRYGSLPYAITASASDITGRNLVAGDVRGNIQIFKINTLTGRETVQSNIQSVVNEKIEKQRTKPYRYTVQPQEIYTNKRSGQINCIMFSPNTQYILAGSNEGNIRVWKSLTWKKAGNRKQIQNIQERQQLINKYQNVQEIHQILNSRKLPKKIATQRKRQLLHQQAEQRKGKQGNVLDITRKDDQQ